MATTLQSAHPSDAAAPAIEQLHALLHDVAITRLDDLGWIRVTGSDRVRWLNGMVTNAIQQLTSGQGCYNFVLNAQGRIQGDLTAFLLEDCLLLETGREQVPALLAHFDRFIIMDDVELADITAQRSDITAQRTGIGIVGPHALQTVQALGGAPCSTTSPPVQLSDSIDVKSTAYQGAPVDLIHAYSPIVPRFEIWADPATIALMLTELAAVPTAEAEAVEALRILEGTPRYGVDIRNTDGAHDLPQETGQTRALHFAKGCYLGQEIVERIRSRGKVHRAFSGFELTGTLPAAGTPLTAEGKPAGELTSTAAIPLRSGTVQLGLGYIRREALERNQQLEYPGGSAKPIEHVAKRSA